MSNSFYREFEDKLRGSRELIKSRLGAYTGFLIALRTLPSKPLALDLGCGRGEWLELLRDHGFEGRGVDLDDGMLNACRILGLEVERADALTTLRALPSESLALVSAFHVIEHISFDDLRSLTAEALRVLVPGGLLILETPNPENLYVGSSNFHLDPSHQKPIPYPLLAFVVEYAGFKRQTVMRLQEPAELRGAAPVRLLSVLTGVSPDYAIVAQKGGAVRIGAEFDAAFDKTYGLSLTALAERYDLDRDARLQRSGERTAETHGLLNEINARLVSAEARTARLEARCATADFRMSALESRVVHADILEQNRVAQARCAEAEQRIRAIQRSTSWRITAPLRMAGSVARGLAGPARVSTLASIARRLGIYAPARALYRALHPVAPAAGPSPAPAQSGGPTRSVVPREYSDDAERVARQLEPFGQFSRKKP